MPFNVALFVHIPELKTEDGYEDSTLSPESLTDWYEDDISSDEGASEDVNIDSEELQTESKS